MEIGRSLFGSDASTRERGASGVEANDSEGRDARAVGFGPRT